ncbi:O-antigen ligase family protein [Hyalangium rubrum]|uniref:O-antigen ligase family protein n=1 Tax=Hyalangium rubrum TaxID=3103134 RepID=A0ABU5H4S4_9BACT|nr:O-antigen ligase family protein [Hyalangium sp. s54d21]MDY7228112.1 O-antigen ligase family protein [Hyalangium sp. s54d21]
MSWIRCAGLGFIAALYVLAGRWGFHRLASTSPQPDPFLELRLWIVMGGLVLATMGLVHRAHRATRPGESRLDPRLSMALLLFFGYLCVSALWAPDVGFALGKLYELVLVVVMSVGFGLAALRQRAERVLDAFWAVVVAATALLALTGVRQLLGDGGGARLAVLGGGPNIFARLMGLLALGALYFWYRRGQAWLWIPLAATGVLLALLTGSRGGTAAIIAGVATFLVVARVPLRRFVLLSVLATAAFAVATTLSPLGKALNRSMEERFLRLTLKYAGSSDSESKVYLSGRESLYAAAYELGLDNPVAGAGLAAFPALGLGVYPHNLFLEVFCEGGALGLVLLAWVLLAFLRSVFRGWRDIDGATVGAVVLMLLGSQSSGDLYDTRALFLLMVMAACTSSSAYPAVQGAT